MIKTPIKSRSDDESFLTKYNVEKYISHWPWFLISIIVFLLLGSLYLRYASIIYESSAKIKIIEDSKELDIATDPILALARGASINLDNEIEILKSYRLLDKVVKDLDLDVSYYEVGNVSTKEIYPAPFKIIKLFPDDSLKHTSVFKVTFETSPPTITDEQGLSYPLDSTVTILNDTNFPVAVHVDDIGMARQFKSQDFKAVLKKRKNTTLELSKNFKVDLSNKDSEILTLRLQNESAALSETVLNTIIEVFNKDGINDRQQVSKRTLEFIDERFEYLTQELDSIEGGKQNFKKENNLSYIETDAESSLMRKAETEEEVSKLGTQISLATVLKQTVLNQSEYALLPINIGLENPSLNASVSNYNQMALERDRLSATVGESHPTLVTLSGQLERAKVNIIKTVNVYQAQLRTSLRRLNQEKSNASSIFSSLPEKEKMLRSIERQQDIKENLFLLLLQKREEAAINLAVTAPSVKVVDYALTEGIPVSPNKAIIRLMCIILGLLVPFILIYLKLVLNNKISSKEDVLKSITSTPILGEIPNLDDSESLIDTDDRSLSAEAFRTLSTNVNHVLDKENSSRGRIIFITSTIKGEGKTQIAQNLSLAYASLNKKVLLVGADLRNPQLFGNSNAKKSVGLSDYLNKTTDDWESCIKSGFTDSNYHYVCYSGSIPKNAPQLLSNNRFEQFINNTKKVFDYIIVDTAPTMLVTDTLLIAKNADITVFVVRAGFTEKRFLEFSEELYENNKLKNMAYVINDADFGNNSLYYYDEQPTNKIDKLIPIKLRNKAKQLLEMIFGK